MEKPFTLKFPVGGLDKSKGYSTQPPFTTVDSMNVWPSDWTEGRERGGTRPVLVEFGDYGGGTPLNWTELVYVAGSENKRGIAVAVDNGVMGHVYGGFSADETGWKKLTEAGENTSDFASCAVFLQELFYANANGKALVYDLVLGDTNSDGLSAKERFQEDGTTPFVPAQHYGAAPEDCGVVCSHGGRLWFGGDTKAPQVLYASRVGDARDWDYSAIDAGAAWAASGGVEGKISEPITSLFTHMSNNCLLVGCTDSTYVVLGNPRIGSGGHVRSISNAVGPLMQSAICKVGDDRTFFFSRDGLYVVRPGCGEPPTPVSRTQLPKDLVGISPGDGETVSIGYDALHKGIHIYAQLLSGPAYFFYDLQKSGFWEMDFDTQLQVACTYPAQSTNDKSGLIAIGSKAYQFNSNSALCDRESYLWYGPFALGSPHTEGILTEISAAISQTSGPIQWGIYTGETAEHALADPHPFEGTINDQGEINGAWTIHNETFVSGDTIISGLSYKSNPVKRGTMGYLKVESYNKLRWSIEEIMCVRRIAGRRRVG
jgi:hypothetical protein